MGKKGGKNLKEYQYNVRIALFETRMNGIVQSQKDLLSNFQEVINDLC